jgi:hypothetical protein
MKIVWILVALLCAGACGVLGFLLATRKPVYQQVTSPRTIPGADQDDIIESYLKVDPKLIIAKEEGRLSTGLKELRAIAVGPDDRIYAAGDKCFEIFGADGKVASKVDLNKTPTCIATDSDSTVYVGVWDHVEVFDSKGAKTATWEKPGPSAWLTSLAVSDKDVYAADFGDKTVVRYDKKGKIQGRLGEPGKIEGTGKYEIPRVHRGWPTPAAACWKPTMRTAPWPAPGGNPDPRSRSSRDVAIPATSRSARTGLS